MLANLLGGTSKSIFAEPTTNEKLAVRQQHCPWSDTYYLLCDQSTAKNTKAFPGQNRRIYIFLSRFYGNK
jgi:hypothetical protein